MPYPYRTQLDDDSGAARGTTARADAGGGALSSTCRILARWAGNSAPFQVEEAELGRVDWVDVLEAAKRVTSMPLNNDIGSDMVVGLGKMGKLAHAEEAFQLTLQKQCAKRDPVVLGSLFASLLRVDEPNSYLLNSMLTAYNRCGQPEKVTVPVLFLCWKQCCPGAAALPRIHRTAKWCEGEPLSVS